jgi:hypothetical protein
MPGGSNPQCTEAAPTDLLVAAGNTAAGANNLTIGGVAGRMTMLTGFEITGLGATSGSTITVTVTGTASANTPTYYVVIPAGTGVAITPFIQSYGTFGIPGSAPGQSITVNVPSFGSGNTNASVVAHGYLV